MFSRRAAPEPPRYVATPPQQTDGLIAAKAARNNTRDRLLDAVDRGVESRIVAARMRQLLNENHFGMTVEQAFLSDQQKDDDR